MQVGRLHYLRVCETKAMSWLSDLPDPLRRAAVVLSEADISTDAPVPLHGRVDQVLLNQATRMAYLVDTKVRRTSRVFPKDIIQMSVYRVILERQSQVYLRMKARVSPIAYVRIPVPNSNRSRYIAVELLGADVVFKLAMRYRELRQYGMAARPTFCASPAFCHGCEVRQVCPRWQH